MLIDRRIGVRTAKRSMEATKAIAEQEWDIGMKSWRNEEVFVMNYFVKGQRRMFLSFVSYGRWTK